MDWAGKMQKDLANEQRQPVQKHQVLKAPTQAHQEGTGFVLVLLEVLVTIISTSIEFI